MFEGGLAYSSIDLVIGFLSIALGIYVFLRNPYLRLSKLFLLVTIFYFIVTIADFFMTNSPDSQSALVWARVGAVGVVLAFAGQFYLVTMLPFEKNSRYLYKHRMAYLAITVILALVAALSIDAMWSSFYGWRAVLGPAMVIEVLIVAWFAAATVSSLALVYERSGRTARNLIVLLLIGITFPLVFILVELGLSLSGHTLPTVFPVGFIVCGVVFMYEVVNYDLFQFKPATVEVRNNPLPETEEAEGMGKCWLIEGKKSDQAYLAFLTSMEAGGKGLVISCYHPDRVREDYHLVKIPIIWLATQPGPDRIDPASLSILQHTIVDFLQKGTGSVVLLDGLDYLVSENQADRVLRMIYAIRDAVTVSGSKLLVPLDPDVLELKDRALLEREFDILRTEEGAGSEI